ncbi:MAG: DMT family transporter [Myxococcota bacterium]
MIANAWFWAGAAALLWATLDAVRKRLARDVPSVTAVVWLSLGPAVAFVGWAVAAEVTVPTETTYWAPALGSVLLNAVAYVSFMEALARSPLSLTIPLLSLSPVFTAGAAFVTVGEVPSLAQLGGVSIVVAGAFELQRPSGAGWSAVGREPGAKYMLLTALLWSLSAALDKRALAHAAVPFHAAVQTAGIGCILVAGLAVRGRTHELAAIRRGGRPFVLALLLTMLAIATQLIAYERLLVSLVEALKRGTGVVVALLLGRYLFRERISPRQIVVALAIAGGAVLVLTA